MKRPTVRVLSLKGQAAEWLDEPRRIAPMLGREKHARALGRRVAAGYAALF